MDNIKVIVGFPEITELRIGSALRITIMQYVHYNVKYDNIIPYEKLLYLLRNVKHYYRFKTVKRYSEYVIKFFLGEKCKIEFEDGARFDVINKEIGEKTISIEVLEYLNNYVLPKIVDIAIQNLHEDGPRIWILNIKNSSFVDYYKNSCKNEEEAIQEFCEDFFNYLEYQQIIHIPEFIVEAGTKDVLVPIKFSFIKDL